MPIQSKSIDQPNQEPMKKIKPAILNIALTGAFLSAYTARPSSAQSDDAIPPSMTTPDVVETGLGKLTFKNGAPTPETAKKVKEFLTFTNGLNVYNNSFRGASAYALQKGFQSIGAEDNSVVIFPELLDSNSLFLTGNTDTVYYLSTLDLTKGPIVVEQPPKSVGTINDMWFSWIIDIGAPGPDRGEGGKYLIVPPGYDGLLPDSGFHVAHSKTTRALYACRAYLVDNDPKPAVEMIKKHMKIYPYTPGGFGTSIATALEGGVRLGTNPPIPETKFVNASGKVFNTIPPSDYTFFEMINENVQQEPATSYDVELAGQLAAIGIVKGKPFNPDADTKRVLTDAAKFGNATGRVLNWHSADLHPEVDLLRGLDVVEHAVGRWRQFRNPTAGNHQGGHLQASPSHRCPHARFADCLLLRLHARLPRHDHASPKSGLAVSDGHARFGRQSLRWRQDLQGHAAEGHPRRRILVADPL